MQDVTTAPAATEIAATAPVIPQAAQVPADPVALIMAKLSGFSNGFFLQLPNMIATAVFLVVIWLLARYLSRSVTGLVRKRGRADLGTLLGSMTAGLIWIIGLLGAAAILFPSVKPASILGGLGLGSVAIGFAFKDILQNLLAGLLLLIQRPYKRGDQITVLDYEGTIEHIESRATALKTYDGRRVVIPNAALYTSPVEVHTAFEVRRDSYDVGIGYGDDPELACKVFLEALDGIEGLQTDPKPETLLWSLDDSYVTVRVRWWTKSLRTEMVHVRPRVILAIHKAAKAHSIDLPYPTTVMLFHDQSEESDGDRANQREGWPSTKSNPKARGATTIKLASDDETPTRPRSKRPSASA